MDLPDAFDLAVVDGPPRYSGILENCRGEVFNQLVPKIRQATIVMDDAEDPAIIESAEKWARHANGSLKIFGNPAKNGRRFCIISPFLTIAPVVTLPEHMLDDQVIK